MLFSVMFLILWNLVAEKFLSDFYLCLSHFSSNTFFSLYQSIIIKIKQLVVSFLCTKYILFYVCK